MPGIDLGAPAQTLGVFLEHWLADSVRPRLAPKTHKTYRDLMRVHVIPALGTTRLDRLTAQQVATLLREKADAGTLASHGRPHPLGPAQRPQSGGQVEPDRAQPGRPDRSAAPRAAPRGPPRARKRHGPRLRPPGVIVWKRCSLSALFLGLRQGEILGLRWADVDLDAGTLSVTQALQRVDGALILKAPKTEKSRRRLTLPASVVAALRAHRDRQAFERQAGGGLLERIRARLHHHDRHAHRSAQRTAHLAEAPGRCGTSQAERFMSPGTRRSV